MKSFLLHKKTLTLNILLYFVAIFWLFALIHQLYTYFQPIPAFQNNTTITYPISTIIPNSSTSGNTEKIIYKYLKQYDKEITLISSHHEKNYTDIYLYSPLLDNTLLRQRNHHFNLQVAVTTDKIYFGTPFITCEF